MRPENFIRKSNRFGSKINLFRLHIANTSKHENLKFQVFSHLRRMGHRILTEAIFTSGGRADIVDLTTQTIYEILVSEKQETFEKKKEKYPTIFKVVRLKKFDKNKIEG